MEKPESYNHLLRLIGERYSCRSYSDRQVSRELIEAVIESARLAPSACNRQPWTFVVLTSNDERAKAIASYTHRKFLAEAPVIIVACGDRDTAWHRASDNKDHTDVDLSIAIEHICLAATSLGLATCWICNFDPVTLRDNLALPDNIEAVAIIPLGYPTDNAIPEKKRLPLDQIIKWGRY